MNKNKILPSVIFLIVGLVVGFISGMQYKSYQIAKALSTAFSGFNNTQSSNTPQATSEPKNQIIEKNLGDEVQLATLNFTVNSTKEVSSYNIGFGTPITPKENTKLVVVNLSLTNTTKESFYFGSSDAGGLIDDQNRIFTPYSEYLGDKGIAGDLAPSIKKTGDALFEIPADATSYSFALIKSGTNEEYRVKLK